MRVEFHPEALSEFQEAAQYYATQQPGLGLRFVEQVEGVINSLADHPETYAVFEQDVRRCLTKRFPYAVLYTIEPDHILVVAIMHCHRAPRYWRHRRTGNPG